MFQLEEVETKCVSTSKNSENMGNSDETRVGVSLCFEFDANNESLDMIDPKMRGAFYERAANDSQEDLTGHLPMRKFAFEKPICPKWEGAGYTAVLHADLDFIDDLELDDCKIANLALTMKEDGVVGYKFRVYCHPDLEDIGPLMALEKHEVTLSLIPPKVADIQPPADESEDSPQSGLFEQPEVDDEPDEQSAANTAPRSALFARAAAAVRATGNPTGSALATELGITVVEAAALLIELEEAGVIEMDGDEYVVVDEAA